MRRSGQASALWVRGCCSTMSKQGSPYLPLHRQGNHGTCPTEGDGRSHWGWGHMGSAHPNPPRAPSMDLQPQDPGTTRAQPLCCPASPLPLAMRGCPFLGAVFPPSGSLKPNPCLPERWIPASDPGQRGPAASPAALPPQTRLPVFLGRATPSQLFNH